MSIHQTWITKTTQLAAICLPLLCVVGCNSNESENHHVVLTGFGTGAESSTPFKRDGAEPAPVKKVVPVQAALAKAKPVQAAPKQSAVKATPAPIKQVAAKSVQTKQDRPTAKKATPKKVVTAKKPAAVKTVALADAKPAAAAKAEGGQPELTAGTGGFSGTVTFDGPAPKMGNKYAKGAAPKDTATCGLEAIPDELLIVNPKNNGVANVFVYLQKKPKWFKGKAPEKPAVFDQKFCVFFPHNLIVRAGQEVLVKNSDPIVHNTHTTPFRNSGFNSAIAANEQTGVSLTYRSAERLPVKVVCDLHGWMNAYHLVVDHPFAAVTDEDGKFSIPGLKPGKYTFTIWHEKPGYLEKRYKITVKAGEYTKPKKPLKFKAADFASTDGIPLKTVTVAGVR